jgi:hypothetical protein
MNIRAIFSVLSLCAFVSGTALAHNDPQNLKVLSKEHTGKEVEKGMKSITKGLGVKCEACHVKGKFHVDEVKTKDPARDFLRATVGEKDDGKRKDALAKLLKELKLDAAKDEKAVWEGVDSFKKQ